MRRTDSSRTDQTHLREVKSRRIQTTIALAFAALVFGTIGVISILSLSFTQEAVRQTARSYTTQLIDQVQTNIDSYITHMENIAEVVQLNDQVQSYLAAPESLDPLAEREYRDGITTFLNSISRTRTDISLILISGPEGRRVISHDPATVLNGAISIPEQTWYRAALDADGETVVSSSHVQNVVEGEYRWVITLSRAIYDPLTGQATGVMLVDLNFSVINDLLSRISLGNRGYLFIVDSDGRIVYHPRQELIYSALEEEQIDRVLARPDGSFAVTDDNRGERIYTVSTSARTGWKTVGVNYASELVRNRQLIRRSYVSWSLIAVVVAVLVSVLISHRLSRPIMRLRRSMQAVEQGRFDISVDVQSNNEIGALAKDFNIMVAQIRELMRRNAEEQEQKRKSELLALQNQITPHFLYNTLDSVIWMAEGRQYANVVTTVSALARLLRLSVSRGEELVSIRDEIEHINNYLTIQKLRYRDKLDFMIDVDEPILDLRTPKVILQPLVENAIYHGIKNKDGTGRVAVFGSRQGNEVILSVQDDGVGMSEAQLASLLAPPAARSARSTASPERRPRRRHGRVGVRNVHERIQLYFGAEYGLSFRRNGNGSAASQAFGRAETGAGGTGVAETRTGGTTVEVRLPVVTADQEAHHD